MIEFKEPYYLVEFNSSIVNFEIFINDIPAFIHHSGGAIFSHVPLSFPLYSKAILVMVLVVAELFIFLNF